MATSGIFSFRNPGTMLTVALLLLVGAHLLQLYRVHPVMDLILFLLYYVALVIMDYLDDGKIRAFNFAAYVVVGLIVIWTIYLRLLEHGV